MVKKFSKPNNLRKTFNLYIKNSVNFPNVHLKRTTEHRISIINKNVPAMIGQIATALGDLNLNIAEMTNVSRGEIAYNLIDIENDVDVTTVATLKMLNPTWLQLRDESNNIILSKLMDKDEEFSYELKLNYNITAGNAGNILVLIDGEVRGKIGKFGDILDSFVLFKDFTN